MTVQLRDGYSSVSVFDSVTKQATRPFREKRL